MKSITRGFVSELLEKRAGLVSLVTNHPAAALNMGFTALGAVPATIEGARQGMTGDTPRVLQASKFGPSPAAYQNYHEFFPHDLTMAAERRLGHGYRASAYRKD